MAELNYEMAVYGTLCYIFGSDDGRLSPEEQNDFTKIFLKIHDLEYEEMQSVRRDWSKGSPLFFKKIVDNLNSCSKLEKLEAIRTICKAINYSESPDSASFSLFSVPDRWGPASKIQRELGITQEDYEEFLNENF